MATDFSTSSLLCHRARVDTEHLLTPAQGVMEPMEIIEIIANWDLTVKVKSCDTSSASYIGLRVSRFVLCMISPVFDAMLNGGFVESRSSEIELHDNNEELLILFACAHHQRHLLPEECSFEVKFGLWALADKYDCFAPIRTAIEILVPTIVNEPDYHHRTSLEELTKELCLAHAFGLYGHFENRYAAFVKSLNYGDQDVYSKLVPHSPWDSKDWGLGQGTLLLSEVECLTEELLNHAIESRATVLQEMLQACHREYKSLTSYPQACAHAGICTALGLGCLVRLIEHLGTSPSDPKADDVSISLQNFKEHLWKMIPRENAGYATSGYGACDVCHGWEQDYDEETPHVCSFEIVEKELCRISFKEIGAMLNGNLSPVEVPFEIQKYMREQARR